MVCGDAAQRALRFPVGPLKAAGIFTAAGLFLAGSGSAGEARPLAELQHEFVNTRFQAYFHYNMCTFKNAAASEYQGRSNGEEPATMFNPSGLKINEWVEACRAGRMAGGWLTTKHHGGFCLWDSEFTDYDVASSGNTTDVVRVFTDAFRQAGLKIGLYYSMLDYHHGINNGVTSPKDLRFLKNQITELLTNYGPIDYINFDGWSTWPTTPDFDDIPYGEILALVKSLQPNCLIISHTYESNLAHAEVPFADAAGRNYPYHPDYLRPTAASDFIQRGWWWDGKWRPGVQKSVKYILGKLDSYNSHNSVYILNISPNTDGGIDPDVIARLREVSRAWKKPADIPMAGNWGYQYDVKNNLAFMKPCEQSSLHPYVRDKRAWPRPEIAVDGVTEGNALVEQTSWTMEEENPWWRVDLESAHAISGIEVYGRTDVPPSGCYIITLHDSAGNPVWRAEKKAAAVMRFPVPQKSGRFVKVQLKGRGELALAEVLVREGTQSR